MKYHVKNGVPGFNYVCDRGVERFLRLPIYHLKFQDRDILANSIITYCESKTSASYTKWLIRINNILYPTLESLPTDCFPTNTKEWRDLIKLAYINTLVSPNKKALSTRIDEWNKNMKPFLNFLKERDIIPLHIVIPKMKKRGEVTQSSSYKVVLIGDKKAKEVKVEDNINNLLVPISLSRNDSEYLDEIHFDLKKARDALYDCLLKYWNAIKAHYDFAQSLMETFPSQHPKLLERYNSGDLYDIVYDEDDIGKNGKPKPPRKIPIASPISLSGSKLFTYIIGSKLNGIYSARQLSKVKLPKQIAKKYISSSDFICFPELGFEVNDKIDISQRFDWCFGYLRNSDIGCLIALLMMLNPKFNYISLLQAKVKYIDGKPLLEMDDLGMAFSITKARAADMKKEHLDETSLDIIEFLHEIRNKNLNLIENKKQENFLFLSYSRMVKGLVNPDSCKVDKVITGSRDKKETKLDYQTTHISTYFPSLIDIGLGRNVMTHSKIRATEGILEFFKTGSIKSVSRVLGNSQRVALEYYIPEHLIALYNTRIARRFQNLLILAATYKEDYCLEAVDFHSWDEIHRFLVTILDDEDNKSPLIEHLRQLSSEDNLEKVDGILSIPLSLNSLTALYLYRLAALSSSVNSKVLSIKDNITQLSPLSIITLAGHLINVLPTYKDSSINEMNKRAIEKANLLINKTNWANLFISRGKTL